MQEYKKLKLSFKNNLNEMIYFCIPALSYFCIPALIN